MRIEGGKSDTLELQPHIIPEVENHEEETSEWKFTFHTSVMTGQAPRESTM